MAGAIGLLIRLTSCHKKSLLIHFPRKFLEPPLTSDAAESAGMNFNIAGIIAGIPGHHLVLMTSQVTINRLCEAPIDQKSSQVASSA